MKKHFEIIVKLSQNIISCHILHCVTPMCILKDAKIINSGCSHVGSCHVNDNII